MATSLDKLENKVQIYHLYIKSFHNGEKIEDCENRVQYIRRYSIKYAKPCEQAMQFPSLSLFSAKTTGPIFTKILHVIVALVVLLYFAYTRRYTIPSPNGIATK